jgi:general secretion pathway protein A
MYCTFYGLKERPFTLTPNPEFIFLGKAHQEAFAHLLYGIGQKVGFIALTGEVGAGKTTVIRTMLSRLEPENYATALILNPMLSTLGLLKTINREFGISDIGDEPAELVETLNRFLLSQNEAGKTVVLVIDEAQDMEPQVLEQVRLLSNLETATEKLIQIILVGQPELETLLSRTELRQLNQRITVRYHMTPMNGADTRDYLAHRLRSAGGTPDLIRFHDTAAKSVHSFSGGLPRLVNAVADRALLIGYNQNSRQIDAAMIKQAMSEVSPTEGCNYQHHKRLLRSAAVLIVLSALVVGVSLFFTRNQTAKPQLTDTTSIKKLIQQQQQTNVQEVYQTILQSWHIPISTKTFTETTPETALKRAGLETIRYNGNLGGLARIGYPAILELSAENGEKRYLVFAGLNNEHAQLANKAGDLVNVSTAELEQIWNGQALIPWKNMLGLHVPVPYVKNSTERELLARLLVSTGSWKDSRHGVTIVTVREALKSFQSSHGLEAAGVAGSLTLLQLYRHSGEFRSPTMKKSENIIP